MGSPEMKLQGQVSQTIATDQNFYDLRWAGADEITVRERNRVAATVGMVPSDCCSILDVGAGNGLLSNELAARGKSLLAVDISEVALSRVKAPTLQRSADNLQGVEDRSFDLVLCTEMLEHLDDATYQGALREFNRVALSAILVTVPNRENMRENMSLCGDCRRPFHIWSHRRRFTPLDLKTLFPGFEPVSISAFGDNLRQYNPVLLWMRTRIANAWAVDDISPCPECHSFRPATPKRQAVANLCDLINSNLPHLPHKPWLAALYRRKQN
jgi:SAM-dependent methyltransferase